MAAAGLDVDTYIGFTLVAERDAVDAIKLCLELGDDVNTVSTYGENALHGAGYRGVAGSNLIAQLLLDRGIEVNLVNKRGWSPITLAEGIYSNGSNSRNPELERLLLAHGAKPSPPGIERDSYAVIVEPSRDKQ
jgi:ankyrin repeat protein